MAKIKLFHETNVPNLNVLKPAVPKIDQKPADAIIITATDSGAEDTRPAVWLMTQFEPSTIHRAQFKYSVEVDDGDPDLLPYDWVPGWYRYLGEVKVSETFVLNAAGDRYEQVSPTTAT